MTLIELKQRIDNYIGISSSMEVKGHDATLTYLSPTGKILFDIMLYGSDDDWAFGGTSAAMPEHWSQLAGMHRRK